MNNTLNNPLTPVWGQYTPLQPGTDAAIALPQWAMITAIKLSGWAWDPALGRWSEIVDARMDPAKTRLDAQCSCPIRWQTVA